MKEIFVAHDHEIGEGGRKIIDAGGIEVGVFRFQGTLHAWRNMCPHQGGPVCQGRIFRASEERLDDEKRSLGIHYKDGTMNIVCPWHGFEFDVRTGRHCGIDAIALDRHEVVVRDGDIHVVIDP
jgi:nitrite reductase/ring-hydroxylating ferredoxin subunit